MKEKFPAGKSCLSLRLLSAILLSRDSAIKRKEKGPTAEWKKVQSLSLSFLAYFSAFDGDVRKDEKRSIPFFSLEGQSYGAPTKRMYTLFVVPMDNGGKPFGNSPSPNPKI